MLSTGLHQEKGEQGDALMLPWTTCGSGSSQARMVGEVLLAILDDVYVVTTPERRVFMALQDQLFRHARIRIHGGKTQVWNAVGERLEACDALERIAQAVDPSVRVWKGAVIPREQGVRVLGTPLGHVDFEKVEDS